VATVPSELSLIPLRIKINKYHILIHHNNNTYKDMYDLYKTGFSAWKYYKFSQFFRSW
jgi:hypothetical protein